MKKTWNSVLALLLAAGLAGCSSAAPASSAAASSAEEPEETTEETTEETAEETTEETTEETADVMSYADYVAADMDAAVTIETFVQGKQSWWQDAATLYCQSEEGALFLSNRSPFLQNPGDTIPPVRTVPAGNENSRYSPVPYPPEPSTQADTGSWSYTYHGS